MANRLPRPFVLAAVALGCLAAAAACDSGGTPPPSAPPVVSEVLPHQITGDRTALLILTGSGFRPGVRLAVGGNLIGGNFPGSVSWVNETVVAAVVEASPGRPLQPGKYTVGVTNLDGKFAKLDFVLEVAPPAPAATPPPAATASPTASPSPTATPAPTRTAPPPSPAATATPTPTAVQPPATTTPTPAQTPPGSPRSPASVTREASITLPVPTRAP